MTPAGARPSRHASPSRPATSARLDWRFRARRRPGAPPCGTATTGGDSDAVELTFPCCRIGLKREPGVAGHPGAGDGTATLAVPATSNPAARTIEVALAPSMAGSMLGALDFLTGYPYGCTEQTLSSFLPNLRGHARA